MIHELDQESHGHVLQEELVRMTGQTSVPNVFIHGLHVGGNDDVQRAFTNGSLQDRLHV